MRTGYSQFVLLYVLDRMHNMDRKQLYLIYSIGLDEQIKIRLEAITKETGFENVRWVQAGAMISTHAGPEGFGIAGIE